MKLNDSLYKYLELGDYEFRMNLAFDIVLDILELGSQKDVDMGSQLLAMMEWIFNEDDLEEIYSLVKDNPDHVETIVTSIFEAIEDDKMGDENDDTPPGMVLVGVGIDGNPIYLPDPEAEESYWDDDEQWVVHGEKIYDLDIDADRIYSSFMFDYGINLFEMQGKLQWNEFNALLIGLSEETQFKKVVHIRTWKPDKHTSQEQKREMNKLKRKYRIVQTPQ
jgi:hypothetical protein